MHFQSHDFTSGALINHTETLLIATLKTPSASYGKLKI